MNFPIIKIIDDILPFIKNTSNFSINQKDDYIVINYILNNLEFFNNPIEHECRGIIFSAIDGKILSRPFHKFFNFNERPETTIDNIDFSKKHWILKKVDGSMIRPFYSNGKIIWGSKAGETFLTAQVEEFVEHNIEYLLFSVDMILSGWTPVFEWCSRKNRIVLDYPEDRLILLALRSNLNGNYMTYDSMKLLSNNIDIIDEYEGSVRNMQHFLTQQVKDMTGVEGFVIRFDDGLMIKIKCDEYLRYHKAKDDINLEKNVISILINNQADDFCILLNEQDRSRFEKFEKDFIVMIDFTKWDLYNKIYALRNNNITRKEFALNSKNSIKKSIIFSMFDISIEDLMSKIYEEIISRIKKNCNSQTNIDKIRELFGNINWYNYK